MKRILRLLSMMLMPLIVLASCLNDDSTTAETYSDTAITAVTMGTLNRYIRTTSTTTGNDTIIKSTLAGSSYKLTIDQLGCKIYNHDSLPQGTDLKHVVFSAMTTKNNGVAFIKSLISDTLFYVTSTDSLDFTQPRIIRVMASNGVDYRDYTMSLSASTTKGVIFGWQLVRRDDSLAGWTDKHLVAFGDTVALVDGGTVVVRDSGKETFMRLGSNGNLEAKPSMESDALWLESTPAEGNPVAKLIGATANEIFALGTDGRLKVSSDGRLDIYKGGFGLTWRDEELDDSLSLLPTETVCLTSWKYAPADSTDYVLLAGNNGTDSSNAACWRKLSRYHEVGLPAEGMWVYMPIDGYNRYALPRLEYLSMTYYNNNVLAVGSNKTLYQSRDQGITWKESAIYELQPQMGGSRMTIAADTHDRLWLVTDSGELWKGTLW